MGEVFNQQTLTARRQHTCLFCAAAIRTGDRYERWVSADEGRLATVKAHPECTVMWHEIEPFSYECPEDPYEFRRSCEEAVPGPFPWQFHA